MRKIIIKLVASCFCSQKCIVRYWHRFPVITIEKSVCLHLLDFPPLLLCPSLFIDSILMLLMKHKRAVQYFSLYRNTVCLVHPFNLSRGWQGPIDILSGCARFFLSVAILWRWAIWSIVRFVISGGEGTSEERKVEICQSELVKTCAFRPLCG